MVSEVATIRNVRGDKIRAKSYIRLGSGAYCTALPSDHGKVQNHGGLIMGNSAAATRTEINTRIRAHLVIQPTSFRVNQHNLDASLHGL